jgi:uncharacterized metal-binding protein YceD (DUF177 family)
MSAESPWTYEIEVSALPSNGQSFELAPDAATRARLAKHAGVNAVQELSLKLDVKPTEAGAEATGELTGVVRQTCVVSLEEFDSPISEGIEVDFATDSVPPSEEDEDTEGQPDPIIDGKIDLGALASEFLILAIDPYPRKPGASLPNLPGADAENSAKASPFERLSGLKDRIKK